MNQNQETDESLATRRYHEWYYNHEIWRKTTFLGIVCLKSVSDMWNYQEIIFKHKPSLIIEFGTYQAGATLYFSSMLKLLNKKSKVLTVDLHLDPNVKKSLKKNSHIQMLQCSSTDPKVSIAIRRLRKKYRGPAFFILDSDHSKTHVLAEMESLREATFPGDYVVVEDGNVNGNPVLSGYGEGPFEAILEYFTKYPSDYIHDYESENKFGFTFAPQGFLIRK
jgi:cephalosporin hydroxylase